MKNIKYALLLLMLISQFACVIDPLKEIEEGDWNNERNVINIKLENQVGKAVIERIDDQKGIINLTINVDAVPDLSSIKMSSIQLSYGATSSVNIGDPLNFENASKSTTMTVTSPTGKTREYTIIATSFKETILGTYKITDLIVYGGTGPEYGGGGVMAMTSKPWIWPETGGPAAELDNTLTFTLSGITDEGNTYGKVVNNAGTDGLFADFTYILDPVTDVSNHYRKIPTEEGEWSRNYTTGAISFTFPDGKTTSCTFIGAGTEDLGNGKSKITTSNAFRFTLSGKDDWDKIYSDYDKFVKRPRVLWIDVTPQ
ncbi:MAG: hypothetical protein K0M40_07330 [Prolixibacteraceae bacterium]|nr:hypothetical protein [Prolixibacteraceae bacterium]